jgi:NAD(P)-dependent dehydrogenase (short-subunit alcohol dehydrogenase family)
MNRLSGKVALISGGTSGMGAATAKLFAAEGATVVVTGSNDKTVEAARKRLNGIEAIACDAGDLPAITGLVKDLTRRHGRIDVLFVNAGIAPHVPVEQVDEALFDRTFDVNTRGAFFLVKEVVRVMPDGGSIVLTSSMSQGMGIPGFTVYAASKAALRSLGRTFAAEFAPRNIRVNTISPGPIETSLWDRAPGRTTEQISAIKDQFAAKVPLKRLGRPEEIADAALFLASDASSFITGIELPVDGGQLNLGSAQ